MATLNQKIKEYLKDNSKTYKAERNNYVLQNDGSGDYIKSWNVSDLAEPNAEQIASYETTGNAAATLSGVLSTRKSSYGSLHSQLDLLYHDMLADKGDKTGEWFKAIKTVKDANPK